MTKQSFSMLASAVALVSALLGGCADTHQSVEAISRDGSSPSSTDEAKAVSITSLDVKTVRPRDTPMVPASDTRAADSVEAPTVEASAVPTPREIFDFHPAGSAAGSFRQPFIIDPNDGPLSADVRRTAAELKEFNATMKSNTGVAAGKRCGEMNVAHDKPGCVEVKPKSTVSISRDPLALQ